MLNYLTWDMLLSFCLKSGCLNDFEGFWVCRLLFLIYKLVLKGLHRQSDFSPRKSHRSAFKLCSKKVKRFTLLFISFDRKSIQQAPRASPRRKLKCHRFWMVKMHSKIHMCQWVIVPLIASFWFDVVKQ